MTALTPRQAQRPLAWSRVLLPAALFGLLPLAASAAPTNTVESIQTVQTQVLPPPASKSQADKSKTASFAAPLTTYNITVTSTDDFPMTDSIITLSIGGKEFTSSAYAPGGAMNSLVFSLTRAQFQSLSTGDKITLYYGADNAALPAAQWNFGTLDLSRLDKPGTAAAKSVTTKTVAAKTVTKKK